LFRFWTNTTKCHDTASVVNDYSFFVRYVLAPYPALRFSYACLATANASNYFPSQTLKAFYSILSTTIPINYPL